MSHQQSYSRVSTAHQRLQSMLTRDPSSSTPSKPILTKPKETPTEQRKEKDSPTKRTESKNPLTDYRKIIEACHQLGPKEAQFRKHHDHRETERPTPSCRSQRLLALSPKQHDMVRGSPRHEVTNIDSPTHKDKRSPETPKHFETRPRIRGDGSSASPIAVNHHLTSQSDDDHDDDDDDDDDDDYKVSSSAGQQNTIAAPPTNRSSILELSTCSGHHIPPPEETLPTRSPSPLPPSTTSSSSAHAAVTMATAPTPERLACDEIDRIIALPVVASQDTTTSSGGVVLVSNKVYAEEKKDETSSNNEVTTRLAPELARNLYSFLNDLDEEVSDDETHKFLSFLEPALPMMIGSTGLTARTTSEIMSLGVDMDISVHSVERLLYESEQLIGHATRNYRELYKRNPTCLVADLVTTMSARENHREGEEEEYDWNDDNEILQVEAFKESYAISEDAIEVHVDVAGIEELSEEEPWWRVASKLNGYAVHPPVPEMTPQQLLTMIDDESPINQREKVHTVVDDINGFWDQQKAKTKHNPSSKQPMQQKLQSKPNRPRNFVSSKATSRNSKGSSDHTISAVASVTSLAQRRKNRKGRSLARPWYGPCANRIKNHGGFAKVEKFSLYESARVQTNAHRLDLDPWEDRLVKQRFLYEQSIAGRNWFGMLKLKAGNVVSPQPVCRPKSMEMPMDADSWTEDWIRPNRKALLEALGPEYEIYMGDDDYDSDSSWEETPECGKLRNVILRPGEVVSRLAPDYTSSLRRSRWRKKYVRR